MQVSGKNRDGIQDWEHLGKGLRNITSLQYQRYQFGKYRIISGCGLREINKEFKLRVDDTSVVHGVVQQHNQRFYNRQ